MGLRALVAAAGVVVSLVGIALLIAPGLVAVGSVEVLLAVLGLLTLLQGIYLAHGRWNHEVDQARPPDPERPRPTPTPGAEFDRSLAVIEPTTSVRIRRRLTDRIESAAAAVLERHVGLSTADARDSLDAGDWTDDDRAASVLSGGAILPSSFLSTVRRALGRLPPYQRRVRDAVDEIARRADVAIEGPGRVVGPGEDVDDGRSVAADGGPPTELTSDLFRTRTTDRWAGVRSIALVGVGLGLLTRQPAVLLAGIVGLGYAGYVRTARQRPVDLTVERSISDAHPDPGDELLVRVTVRNEGDRTVPDLRLVDGVPEPLGVSSGSPRLGVALRPGKVATFEYTVVARRGAYEFDPLLAVVRDVSGAIEREIAIDPDVPTRLTCLPRMRPVRQFPLRAQGSGYSGRVATESGGHGTEFYATREYRPGDPTTRLDWNRFARTGDLATLEFREERVATVCLVVDARSQAARSPDDGPDHAVDRAVDAAGRTFASLLDAGNRVGIAAVGARDAWLAPDAGSVHRARARRLLGTHAAFAPVPPEGQFYSLPWLRRLRRRLPADAQIVFYSGIHDDHAALLVRWLEGYGYPVTVISPDPTAEDTVGNRLARIERAMRLADLRGRGVRVVDWRWDEPLDVAVLRAAERWRG